MSDYKPTEHDGLKQDGTPDKRVGTGEFAYGKVDPHKAGAEGGKIGGTASGGGGGSSDDQDSGDGDYKPTEHDGLRKDGKPDGRVKGN
ncbi:hypothetical protein E4U43_005047 [Claviceps pusilla]|uniref:Uncharacterized protein n=1 Tax=Claviceps pusilla TaxID=123648 RepID=A0A9P7T1P4_9HYPO|nr:hypothetical protein E4U43_005047 [Claviceps pusilla]